MDGFKDLFQGSNCNPSQNAQVNTNNPFKNLMNSLITTPQQLGNFGQIQPNQNMDAMMQQLDTMWGADQVKYNQEYQMQMVQMQALWQADQLKQQEMLHHQEIMRQQAMKQQQQQGFNNNSAMMQQPVFMPMRNWSAEYLPTNSTHVTVQKEEIEQVEQAEPQEDHHAANSELIELMMSDPDPRFQQSEFLSFLKKVQTGEYEIRDNQLIEHEKGVLNDSLTDLQNDLINNLKLDNQFEQYIQQAEGDALKDTAHPENSDLQNAMGVNKVEAMWDNILKNYDENDPQLTEKLENLWKESLKNYEAFGNEEDLVEHWQYASDLEEMQYQNFTDQYKFNDSNPYVNLQNPLDNLKATLQSGDLPHSVLIIEAHLQKNVNDYKAWRSLGILLQDMDQDQKSVSCLLNALRYNPNDKDTYLQLGVSCTNIFDEIHALSFLEKWLHNNPFYKNYVDILPKHEFLVSEERLKEDNWKLEEINQINALLTEKFLLIKDQSKTNDPELNTCLAIMYFINRDYQNALKYFEQVLEHDPTNYSIWNKIGATYAYLKMPEKAQLCYHKALDYKPNYIRGWSNLAINYNLLKKYSEATGFFLNALNLNPNARHIWTYLESTLISDKNNNMLPKLINKDLSEFSHLHNVHSYNELPQPDSTSYVEMFENYMLKHNIDNWIGESKGQTHIKETKE